MATTKKVKKISNTECITNIQKANETYEVLENSYREIFDKLYLNSGEFNKDFQTEISDILQKISELQEQVRDKGKYYLVRLKTNQIMGNK